jgi:Zn-dependent M28 family amino/carboxypeptidase
VARQLAPRKETLRRSVAFVSFDLEERMLWGSRWFAAHAPMPLNQVKLFITADMIGRSLGDLPFPAVFVMGSEHSGALAGTLDRVAVPDGLELVKLGIDYVGTRSDYAEFRSQKIPFLFISTGEHPDYHTPRDLPEKVDFAKVANVSNVVLEVCVRTANSQEAPAWTDEVAPDLAEAKTLHRIASLLLEAEDGQRLTGLQRFIVSQVETRTRQILDRGTLSTNDRKWLVRMAQVMLASVF